MKKVCMTAGLSVVLLVVLLYVFFLRSDFIPSQQPEGVMMFVNEETISEDKLTYTIGNSSPENISFGAQFSLDKKIAGIWFKLPVSINTAQDGPDVEYFVAPDEANGFDAHWAPFGPLKEGSYRIVKE
ncbi:MAG: hypothetical protein Q4C22_06345, partial [Bacillota bacterium]|nr:hypothetical protein [Bacillota bacterium]